MAAWGLTAAHQKQGQCERSWGQVLIVRDWREHLCVPPFPCCCSRGFPGSPKSKFMQITFGRVLTSSPTLLMMVNDLARRAASSGVIPTERSRAAGPSSQGHFEGLVRSPFTLAVQLVNSSFEKLIGFGRGAAPQAQIR